VVESVFLVSPQIAGSLLWRDPRRTLFGPRSIAEAAGGASLTARSGAGASNRANDVFPGRCYHFRMISVLLSDIEQKKAELDRLRPLSPHALANLEHAYDLELTYTSNAIEGNALTQIETSLVIEKGVTIGGKRLKDHLEAIDHYDAILYVRDIAQRTSRLSEFDVRNLHSLVTRRSDPKIAGRYADAGRYVITDTGRHAFPSPAEVPALMGDFSAWLGAAPANPATAFAAHRRLADIHPFNDGNGRTARLLMNLILIRGGYPPIAVRPEDRLAYLQALQRAQAGQGDEAFRRLLYQRLGATLAEVLSALREALP
jgi:Fic family protein